MPATKLCLGATSICEMLYLHVSHHLGIVQSFSGEDTIKWKSTAKQEIKGFKIRQYGPRMSPISTVHCKEKGKLARFTSETE